MVASRTLPLLALHEPRFQESALAMSHGRELRSVMRSGPESELVTHLFEGRAHRVALPVTFTPFASARVCSARCIFCSETLTHRDARTLSASLRPGERYFERLARALRALRGLPFGVSLSGLEATDDREWLFAVLRLLRAHAQSSPIPERVLYTNFVGFCEDAEPLARALEDFGLDRLEISRHDVDEERNQSIMRIRKEHIEAYQTSFEARIRQIATRLPTRLVCVVQKRGVASVEQALRYAAWAEKLGVTDVVFREFSRLGSEYAQNRTARVIAEDRVAIGTLLDGVWPRHGVPLACFEPDHATNGYYFFNIVFRYRKSVRVTFECSDYELMKSRHASDVVYKLIFHANGRLSADWDPDEQVLVDTNDGEPGRA